MTSFRLAGLASAAMILGTLLAGCGQAHAQREVVAAGAPSHLDGPTLVLLPRTCVVDRRVSSRHLSSSGPGARTTLRLRRALDALVPDGVTGSTLPVPVCKPAPDLSADPARLAELRASDDALRLMRERGAQHVVVIEIKATIACLNTTGSPMLAHYGGAGFPAGHVYPGDDICDDEQIELTAFVFREDGAAVWVGTREIVAGEPVEPAIGRLLQRVPVDMPLRAARVSATDVRCRYDDRGVASCT